MQRYTVYLYLETALHVSGGTSTHHQERIQLYLTASGICRTVIATCRYRGRVGMLNLLNSIVAQHGTSPNNCKDGGETFITQNMQNNKGNNI